MSKSSKTKLKISDEIVDRLIALGFKFCSYNCGIGFHGSYAIELMPGDFLVSIPNTNSFRVSSWVTAVKFLGNDSKTFGKFAVVRHLDLDEYKFRFTLIDSSAEKSMRKEECEKYAQANIPEPLLADVFYNIMPISLVLDFLQDKEIEYAR